MLPRCRKCGQEIGEEYDYMKTVEEERTAAIANLIQILLPEWRVDASAVVPNRYVWVRVQNPKYPILDILGNRVKVHAEAILFFAKERWSLHDCSPPEIQVVKSKNEGEFGGFRFI